MIGAEGRSVLSRHQDGGGILKFEERRGGRGRDVAQVEAERGGEGGRVPSKGGEEWTAGGEVDGGGEAALGEEFQRGKPEEDHVLGLESGEGSIFPEDREEFVFDTSFLFRGLETHHGGGTVAL